MEGRTQSELEGAVLNTRRGPSVHEQRHKLENDQAVLQEPALRGIRVLDTSASLAGAYCTWLLAGLGADVILVEPPSTGNRLRSLGPFWGGTPHSERSLLALFYHMGKKSITLNLDKAVGRGIFDRLITSQTVVVVDLSPKEADRLCLTYQALEAQHPETIVTSVTPFGRNGPYRDFAASELVLEAMSGHLFLTGDPKREPLKIFGHQALLQAGVTAAAGIMSALFWRDATGEGQEVDVAVADSLAICVGDAPHQWNTRRILLRRNKSRNNKPEPKMGYPSNTLPCKNGYVHLRYGSGGLEDFAILTNEPRLLDPRLLEEPMGHADEIDALLLPWLQAHTKAEICAQAAELRVPIGEVLGPEEIANDPQHAARNFFVKLAIPGGGPLRVPGTPFRFSATPWKARRSPAMGEHNRETYADELAYAEDDLERLRAEGVI